VLCISFAKLAFPVSEEECDYQQDIGKTRKRVEILTDVEKQQVGLKRGVGCLVP